ncbi:MAG: transcriptional regulator [Acidimicrobiia bacterium]|nr:transcriptional regulator [Acidimicrobiia bacterium]
MASRTKTLVPPTTRPGRRARPRRHWLRSAAGVGIAVALAGLAAVVAHIVPRDHSTTPPASIVPGAVPADTTRPEGGRPSAANRGPGGPSAPTSPVEPPPAPPARPVARAATPIPTPARLDATDPGLAQRAYGLLKRYCYSCHGSTFKVPGYNVLDRDGLVAAPPAGKKRKKAYVVPGAPDASLVWQRVGIDEDMPPEDHPIPSDEEKADLKRWIEAGAPFPVLATPRPFVDEKDVLTAIRDHLETVPADDQPFQRYVTLTHLHNNRKVLDDDLRLYRAAFAKLVNSLSWKPRIVLPRAIDNTHETVYAIDLRELGWDEGDLWRALVRREDPPTGTKFLGARDEERKGYPYGLTHHRDRDEDVRRLAQEVSRRTGCELPYLRADWLIATASRPPLYETILGLSRDARDLERRLGVDVLGDFLSDRLARAGFATSGVSHHNRMLERHDQGTSGGAYWKSYDFKSDEGTAGLLRFPLGPPFDGNPFERQAFEHAGGELIFHLPNKLQGYLLVNARDERIEAGPIEIVGDALQTSGTATVVNGLSCMGCHKNGMIGGFEDTIRAGNALAGEPRAKVERLYPPKAAMDRLVADDEEAFLAALEKATGPFLRAGDDKDKPIRDFPEPIGAIARLYVKDLGLEEVAAELGFAEPALWRWFNNLTTSW